MTGVIAYICGIRWDSFENGQIFQGSIRFGSNLAQCLFSLLESGPSICHVCGLGGKMKNLIVILSVLVSVTAFAGKPSEDAVVGQIKTDFVAAHRPKNEELYFGGVWNCISANAVNDGVSDLYLVFNPYNNVMSLKVYIDGIMKSYYIAHSDEGLVLKNEGTLTYFRVTDNGFLTGEVVTPGSVSGAEPGVSLKDSSALYYVTCKH
jgi:hypothetical protein